MEPLKVAVVGAGYWGPNLVRNALNHKDVELRWICDLDLERASGLIRNLADVRATDDVACVLDDVELDAVIVATPASTHGLLGLEVLKAGKHLLIEKPLADNLDAGWEIVEFGETSGLVVMSDHTFCYTGAVQCLRELIWNGELGDIRFFDSVRINLGLVQSDIDVFWDLAPHDLSILDFILPDDVYPLSVSAIGSDPLGIDQASVGYFSLMLSNGSIAHCHLNWLSPTKVRTTIIGGSRKTVVWNDLDQSQKLNIYDTGVELSTLDRTDLARALVSYRIGDMVAPVLDSTEALHNVLSEFVLAIREKREPLTSGKSGLRVLEQIATIQESMLRGGEPVELTLARRG
jgi:predicted dehydrogenase